MNIKLPVNMIPLPSAGKAGGFVVAILVGLALFMAANASKQPAQPKS